jgi:hypothetical protein
MALVAIIMAVAPRTPDAFSVGVLPMLLPVNGLRRLFGDSSCSRLAAALLPQNMQRSLPSGIYPLSA